MWLIGNHWFNEQPPILLLPCTNPSTKQNISWVCSERYEHVNVTVSATWRHSFWRSIRLSNKALKVEFGQESTRFPTNLALKRHVCARMLLLSPWAGHCWDSASSEWIQRTDCVELYSNKSNFIWNSMNNKPDWDIGASDMEIYVREPNLESVAFWSSSHCRWAREWFTIQWI